MKDALVINRMLIFIFITILNQMPHDILVWDKLPKPTAHQGQAMSETKSMVIIGFIKN